MSSHYCPRNIWFRPKAHRGIKGDHFPHHRPNAALILWQTSQLNTHLERSVMCVDFLSQLENLKERKIYQNITKPCRNPKKPRKNSPFSSILIGRNKRFCRGSCTMSPGSWRSSTASKLGCLMLAPLVQQRWWGLKLSMPGANFQTFSKTKSMRVPLWW